MLLEVLLLNMREDAEGGTRKMYPLESLEDNTAAEQKQQAKTTTNNFLTFFWAPLMVS